MKIRSQFFKLAYIEERAFTGDLLSQVNYESRTYRYALRQVLSKDISQNYFFISSVFWPMVVINKVP